MSTPITITIDADGVTRFLVNDETRSLLTDSAIVKRASHVEPISYTLRFVFHALRSYFGEYGRMAAFTRVWPCLWRVNLKPANGPILSGHWRNRSLAIDAEIQWLNENFL